MRARIRGGWSLAVVYLSFCLQIVGQGAALSEPAPGPDWALVTEYLNLGAGESARELALQARGLQGITPMLVPEEEVGFFGWPHGVRVGDALIVHVRSGSVLLRSRDQGRTWERLRTTPDNIYVGGVAAEGGAVVLAAVDREREDTLSVLRSVDQGDTWEVRDVAVKTPRHLTSRLASHPRFGLIVGGHQSRDELVFLVSPDGGDTWRYVRFELPGFYSDGTVVFSWGDRLGVFARGAHGGSDGWRSFSQAWPTNLDDATRFEDLTWAWCENNIFVAKMDTPDAYYNPVTARIEAVVTKRDAGFPYRDSGLNGALGGRGFMTLNLWSIGPADFLSGRGDWRYEGAMLRSRGEKARLAQPRDGMHPSGSVVDVEHGLHHVFIYAGDHAHGGGAPDTGRTGIFCITRCLDTERWRAGVAELDRYEEILGLREDFGDLGRWVATGEAKGELRFQRTEPPERIREKPLPDGLVEADGEGALHIRTDAPGYYGLHNEDCILFRNYRVECRVRVGRYAAQGDTLGLSLSCGPWQQCLVLRKDGIHDVGGDGQARRVAAVEMDHAWHVWSAEMRGGTARVFLDGEAIGESRQVTAPDIGRRPVTLFVRAEDRSDRVEVWVDYFRITNLDH